MCCNNPAALLLECGFCEHQPQACHLGVAVAAAGAGLASPGAIEGSGVAARGVRGGVWLRHDRMPLEPAEMRSDSACISGCCLLGVVAWDCADVKLSAVCISSFACMWTAIHAMTVPNR